MKKLFKKAAVIGMAGILTLSAAACGSSDESADDGKVAITIFNSKTEIQEYLEEAAATYGEQNNVDIEVYYSNDTVAAHLSSKYAASDPYTIAMTDAKDIYNLASEYCTDLSDQPWVSDTDYAISVDGKLLASRYVWKQEVFSTTRTPSKLSPENLLIRQLSRLWMI